MKRLLYIVAFSFFGLLVATLVHAVVEMIALAVIFGNPDQFEYTLWWKEWDMIHMFASNLLWILGLVGGLYAGVKLWEPYGSKSGCFGWGKERV